MVFAVVPIPQPDDPDQQLALFEQAMAPVVEEYEDAAATKRHRRPRPAPLNTEGLFDLDGYRMAMVRRDED